MLNNDMRMNDMKTKSSFNNDDGKNCTKKKSTNLFTKNCTIYLQKKIKK